LFRPDPLDRGLGQHWYTPETEQFDDVITVPYAWQTAASGIAARWLSVGWYRRTVRSPADWRRTFCVFAGVFQQATVWLNGREVGRHTGGYTCFDIDLTEFLDEGQGVLVVRVEAPADKRFIPHGKQRSSPADDWDGCSFEPTSGIWQPVWLEERPTNHIRTLKLSPSPALTAIEASVVVVDPAIAGPVHYEIDTGDQVLTASGPADGTPTHIELPCARRWSPADPFLYNVTARLETPEGEDVVGGYTGLRHLTRQDGRLFLNDKPIYLRGVLDQGYWPDTGLTAPDDDALRRDIELAAAAGFTLVRKHMKFESPRQLYWADRLGMLMWVEPPAIGRFEPSAIASFAELIEPMVEVYGNHPSVVIWGLFNEEWGLDWNTEQSAQQRAVVESVARLRAADGSGRLVVDDSGWCHVDTDLLDWHIYTADLARWRRVVDGLADGTASVLGIGLGPGALVDRPLEVRPSPDRPPLINSEYGVGLTGPERGWHLRWQTSELRRREENCGYVYCELFDIEHETAGLLTAGRGTKDLGGTDPAAVHADTVIIVDLTPEAVGRDIGWEAGCAPSSLDIPIMVSHHGDDTLKAELSWAWQSTEDTHKLTDPLVAEPFTCIHGPTLTLALPAPVAENGGRIELALHQDDRICATTFLDVGPRQLTGHDIVQQHVKERQR
jgi:hypothetical protein